MKTTSQFLYLIFFAFIPPLSIQAQDEIDLRVIHEFTIDNKIGSLRAVPVKMGHKDEAILFVWSHDKDIDPFIEMFYAPTDRMKFALYTTDGELLWRKTLGKGVLNGIWFTPVFPFDMNQDGYDEIYFVNNTDSVHLLSYNNQRLEALDARNGKSLGSWSWKRSNYETLSHTFRNFILGGFVNNKPVLITGQGTYAAMGLQAWDQGMKLRWDLKISADEPGPRGSHMCPVTDLNGDGINEIFWGERCIDIDSGKYIFIADRDEYKGHSDIVQPTLNRETGEWFIWTCRESGDKGEIKPRLVMFDQLGNRVWSDLEKGHMDMGWTAKVAEDYQTIAFSISRGGKIAGPDGFYRTDVVEYAYEAYTGKKIDLNFSAYNTVPVDLNGDGFHEFAQALGEQADRFVYDHKGNKLGFLGEGAYIAMASRFTHHPGEQILCYYPDGRIKIWSDKNARDSQVAENRYKSSFYRLNKKLTATGYNLVNLGGI